ncbi:LacI family DNA-binding transcriptional regulator [Mesorhizobium humile]|uniref:LacI family DNA-binding transcriptional regulator n=1 Tax=Mesorhizobium humile TaxID=3072313 RepID=A0ABU4YPD5_9HYPH|nr:MULTISPECIES: LacI family DNA-binding transcriptional regulator [unclassified Mesorhizobium]MDX8463168.1 LacI family DNA-binding transcriptional regulator [Mesorhizobium sp. VK2D]MDX8488541.1 LacI family DNA-binding transcriptional regulator [Mesorhizobium sp. VK2B]
MAEGSIAASRLSPTIKTLAAHTGYSIGTISKALRGSPVVTEQTREAILAAAKELGYQANARGMALRTGKTYQAAVLMPLTAAAGYEWDGVEYTQILNGISQALDGSDYQLSVHGYRSYEDACAVARRVADQKLSDGLIFSGVLADDARIAMLAQSGFPFVSLGRCRKPLTYAHVDVDNEWAAHAATARLIAGGHRRIALINAEQRFSYALDRIDGFVRAFREAGLEPSLDLVAGGDLSTRFGRDSTLTLRGLPQPPTALVCVNESTTLGALSALGSLGLRVGEDVDVIAYDDINVSAYFSPPVTTLYQPIEVLGRRLGEFLLRLMAGEDAARLTEVFRPQLIARQADNLGGRLGRHNP